MSDPEVAASQLEALAPAAQQTRVILSTSPNTTYLHAGLFYDGAGDLWLTHAALQTNEVPGIVEQVQGDTIVARYLVSAGAGVKTDMLKCALIPGTGHIRCHIAGHTTDPNQPRSNVRALVTLWDVATSLPSGGSLPALPEPGDPLFSDVLRDSPFYDVVNIAVRAGWASGYSDGTFKPNAPATRGHLVKLLVLALRWARGGH